MFIKNIIKKCFSSNDEERKKSVTKLAEVLFDEIDSSIKGLNQIRSPNAWTNYVFKKEQDNLKRIRRIVCFDNNWGNYEELSVATNELWNKFFKTLKSAFTKYKINNFLPDFEQFVDRYLSDGERIIVNGLIDSNNRKRFIRYNLGMILDNKVFSKQINEYRRKTRRAIKSFKEDIKEKTDKQICQTVYEICPDITEGQCTEEDVKAFALFCLDADINKSPVSWIKNRTDSQELKKHELEKGINNVKKTIVSSYISKMPNDIFLNTDKPEYEESHYHESEKDSELTAILSDTLNNELSKLERNNLQEKFFFWAPGNNAVWKDIIQDYIKFDEWITEVGEPELPISIAFFYTWLMECSGISKEQVAALNNVNVTSVYRWSPHILLEYPFTEENIFPVFFNTDARKQIGMECKSIRVYSKNNINNKNKNDQRNLIKKILWQIYKFVLDMGSYDEIEKRKMGAVNPEQDGPFNFRVCYNTEIDEIKDDYYNRIYQSILIDGVKIVGEK